MIYTMDIWFNPLKHKFSNSFQKGRCDSIEDNMQRIRKKIFNYITIKGTKFVYLTIGSKLVFQNKKFDSRLALKKYLISEYFNKKDEINTSYLTDDLSGVSI